MDSSYGAAQEHYNDLLRDAERERLIRQIHHRNSTRALFYRRVLGWSGQRLTALGSYLLERSRVAETGPVLQVVHPVKSAAGRR